jgi:hypothetical protein
MASLWLSVAGAQTSEDGDGLIVRIQSADLVFIDKGQDDGLTRGDLFDIVSSEILVHPLSDSILAVTPKSIGAIQVLQVFANTSLARIIALDRGEDPMLKPIERVGHPDRLEELERLMARGMRSAAGMDVSRRVAVIPGLYQYRIGEKRKAWMLMAAEAASLIGGFAYRSNSNDWYDQYKALQAGLPQSEYDRYFTEAQDRRDRSNRLFWLAGALYVYNWVDVMWLGEGAKMAYTLPSAPRFHVGMGWTDDRKPLLRLTHRF